MSETNIKLYQLKNKITELETRRDDLIARLPAHSIPPSMIAELDEIEEQLNQVKLQMAALDEHRGV
jgi:chromatin segregation and condensation protein Rec8/ScpA/Scc1 (kleisin family)